jgi:membrane protein
MMRNRQGRVARWCQIASQTIREIGADNCLGLSAQMAFYFVLAVFPALLVVVALIGHLPIDHTHNSVVTVLGAIVPQPVMTLVAEQLTRIRGSEQASLLTVGIVGAIWSSSAAMVAIIDALNRAYNVPEWRPWWRRRLVAIVLTVMLSVFVVVSLALLVIGPSLAVRLAEIMGLGSAVAVVWALIRWPVMVTVVVLGVSVVYHFAPNRYSRWQWLTPGSWLATALWIGCSLLFKEYVANLRDYAAAYGAIAGAIVMMLWFYLSSLSLLIGAELDAVIDSPQRPHTSTR